MMTPAHRSRSLHDQAGLIGKVAKLVDENEVQIELSEGVKVRAVRGMIAEVRAKGEPVKDNA